MNATAPANLLRRVSPAMSGWMAVGAAWQSNSPHCYRCDWAEDEEGAPGERLIRCGLHAGRGVPTDCPAVRAKQEPSDE